MSTLKLDAIEKRVAKEWEAERKKKNPRLHRAILRSAPELITSGVFCAICQGLLSAVGRPLALRALVLGVQGSMGTGEAVGLVTLFGMSSILEGWLGVMSRQVISEHFGTHYIQSVSALVINKVGHIGPQQESSEAAKEPKTRIWMLRSKTVPVVDVEAHIPKEEVGPEDDDDGGQDQEASVLSAMDPMTTLPAEMPLGSKIPKSGKSSINKPGMAAAETSILGNDLVRSYENIRGAAPLPMAITSVIGGVTVLLLTVGSSSLTGLAIMVLILVLNVLISRLSYVFEQRNMRTADERLQLVSAVLESPRAVKLFGWEAKFLSKIETVRDREMSGIARYRIAYAANVVIGRVSPVLSSMVTLVVFALESQGDKGLDMASAFVTVSVFQSLQFALIMIPLATQALMALAVSLGRIQRYLLLPDLPKSDKEDDPSEELLLRMSRASLSFDARKNRSSFNWVLRNVSLEVNRGEIVAICGEVGSGKTALLRGALQLMPACSGTRSLTRDHVGYVPQRAVMIGGTIKDNILLGRPFDAELFMNAITKSQLKQDIDSFPLRENAEVGERGTTLSGGQMQRLSMARALYSKPKLLCLDDPFSAVDARVCSAMFEQCVLDEAHGPNRAGVLLVLNQLSFLPQCDRVVFLHAGRIHATGPYNELRNSNDNAFKRFTVQSSVPEREDETTTSTDRFPIVALGASCKNLESQHDPERKDNIQHGALDSMFTVEARSTGAVSLEVYWSYIRAFGPGFAVVCLLAIVCGYALMTVNDFWLSEWAAVESARRQPEYQGDSKPLASHYAVVLAVLSCSSSLLVLCGSFLTALGGVRASRRLHSEILHRVLLAPMAWFESNPSGRVLSRFSGDTARMDLFLSLTIDSAVQLVVQLLATVVVVCAVVSIYLLPACAVSLVLFGFLLVAVDRILRQTKRLANSAMAPVLSNISETAVGLHEVARAFGGRDLEHISGFFRRRHAIASDEYARANFCSGSLINLSFLAAHGIAFFIAISTASLVVTLKGVYDPALLGLALTYALIIPHLASMSVKSLTNMNMSFTALERLMEYRQLPQEAPHRLEIDPPVSTWPMKGTIAFTDLEVAYRPGLPLCLKGCSFTVRHGESIGIVGRYVWER